MVSQNSPPLDPERERQVVTMPDSVAEIKATLYALIRAFPLDPRTPSRSDELAELESQYPALRKTPCLSELTGRRIGHILFPPNNTL